MSEAPAPRPPKGTRRLWETVFARVCVCLVVALLWGVLYPSFARFQGHGHPTGKEIWMIGTVRIGVSPTEVPELSVILSQVGRTGKEEPVVQVPLRRGEEVATVRAGEATVGTRFRYEGHLRLIRWDPKPRPSVTDVVGGLMHGSRPIRRLWHPEQYRLRVVSPAGAIRSSPAYYDLGDSASAAQRDFAVTVVAEP